MLALTFGITALLYAMVGFAGGSTYLALLALWGVPSAIVPPLALICNAVVATGSGLRCLRARLLPWRLLLPHMALAVPCAYLGGRLDIDKTALNALTALCLTASALLLLKHQAAPVEHPTPPPISFALAAGAVLGLLSGIVGIGGGIFLAPLLYALKAGHPRDIAATCTWFILANSLAGLAGQWHRLNMAELLPYWPLPLAVCIGGQIGSRLLLGHLQADAIKRLTGLLLLSVALLLWWKLAGLR